MIISLLSGQQKLIHLRPRKWPEVPHGRIDGIGKLEFGQSFDRSRSVICGFIAFGAGATLRDREAMIIQEDLEVFDVWRGGVCS